ncbi:hypothetical protein IB238_19515 [Rhizobium sp. ARZ01]|uniref:hypothetical protein n=1 Tax=Rhizobium sp. ARZ01 TaxID=2769313 RepID=UPI001784AD1E|nr:hypothetical protein [Rhizobium sp. ARZ01]MBD9374819.1 hypothetical protein [Rhizobium sp. ARZ01]
MTAIALAVTVPLIALPALARDRHEGGSHRGFSNREVSGGNMTRSNIWKRNHRARNDGDRRNRHRSVITGITTSSRVFRDNHRWWRARNNWNFNRTWHRGGNNWDRNWSGVRNRVRPYYAGPYRPYYAGQYDDRERFNNNFYGGSISAYDDPGNGMYFYVDGYGDGMGDGQGGYPLSARPANNAKVIIVSPETEASSCSFEAGVCVIRP